MKFKIKYVDEVELFLSKYNDTRCLANFLSFSLFGLSNMRYIKSKRLSKVGGNLIFSTTLSLALYLLSTGFAEANIEVLAFRVAIIPALT